MRRLLFCFTAVFLCLIDLPAQDREELQRRKDKTYDEIRLARELVSKTSSSRRASLNQVRILEKGIESRNRYIRQLEEETELLNQDISGLQRDIQGLKTDLLSNRDEYARLIYYAYRNHSSFEKLMYVLAAESINQSYQRYRYLKYITSYRRLTASEISAGIDSLQLMQDELQSARIDKLSVLEEKEKEQDALEEEVAQNQRRVNELSGRERELKREIAEKQRIAKELEARIREVIEAEARKAAEENRYASLTPEQELVNNDFRRNRGKLPWPVEQGLITTGFGPQDIPGLRGSTVQNNGVDISSVANSKVRAVFEGEVTAVLFITGANYTVLIRHGEYLTVYQNLVNPRVKIGDMVSTKEVIGEAYTDMEDQVSNMHFEVYHEREVLNPEEWISR